MQSKQQNINKRFAAFLFSVVPILGITVYLYGVRPLIMVAISVLIAIVSDILVSLMRKQRYNGSDMSSIMYAVIFVLLLPATLNYGLVAAGVVFTVFIKHAFGGYNSCIFHPSAFGFVAAAICWPDRLFSYPATFTHIGLGVNPDTVLFDSATYTIKGGGAPTMISRMDFILGNHPGPLGASFGIVIIAILTFLIACKMTSWHVPTVYLATIVVYAFLFPRLEVGRGDSIIYEVFSDAIIFGAVYIASDPVTSPVNPKAKLIYGFLLGVAAMLFSHYGAYQMGILFAVLLVNPISSYLDRKFVSRGRVIR